MVNFPSGPELRKLLNLQTSLPLDPFLSRSLMEPVQDLFARPRKNIRSELVRLGFEIAKRKLALNSASALPRVLLSACEILEILHAGSLIIDDIEDGTEQRRGQKCLHLQYGLPVALNAGNWLYFLPFQKIEQMEITTAAQALLSKACQRTLLRAHYGQALDVGVSIKTVPQTQVAEFCLAAMELKSGILTGFALQLGALAANCEEAWVDDLELWGRHLGLALQMFDDIGNLFSKANVSKKGEDLRLLRPSFLLAVAAESFSDSDYQEFLQVLGANFESGIDYLKTRRVDEKARNRAVQHLFHGNSHYGDLLGLGPSEKEIVQSLSEKLVKSYE